MNVQWGKWSLDLRELVLQIQRLGGEMYLIPLVKCNSSEEVLDWIVRFRQKPWASGRDLCDLINALDDLLGLEENFCGSGIDWTDGQADYAFGILSRKFGRSMNTLPLRGEES